MENKNVALYANNESEAEQKAKENLPKSYEVKNGESIVINVRNNPDSYINHSGTYKTTRPSGWIFTFTYRDNVGWNLLSKQEIN